MNICGMSDKSGNSGFLTKCSFPLGLYMLRNSLITGFTM
jgi:hypothetical protein